MSREFKSDPINRLGIEHAEFQSNLMQLSLSFKGKATLLS